MLRIRTARRQQRKVFVPSVLRFVDFFLPSSGEAYPDADLQRRARLLIVSVFGFSLIAIFFGIQMSMVDQYPLLNVLIMFSGSGLALANLILLRYTRSTALPGVLLCFEALSIYAFQAYNDLGLDDPVLIWTLVLPWLAAFLVGPGYGFGFAGLVAIVLSGFYLLERSGHPFPDFTGAEDYWLFYFLEVTALALFLGFLGWIYEGQTLKNLREANQELARMHTNLQRSKQRLEETLESITDGFFALDSTWCFTDVNRQAEHFLKRKRSDLVGFSILEFLGPNVENEVLNRLRQAAHTLIPAEFEMYFPTLDRWFEMHLYPYAEGVAVYFNDISDRKEYEQKLIASKEEAEELAHIKSNLLANLSHEIRTPLTSVIGFATILEHEATGDHREFAELIGQNGRRLMETLNSVLDLAQLEQGAFPIHLALLDVGAEVRETVELLRPLAAPRGLEMRVEVEEPGVKATLDRAVLNRILNNLIGNAIKFTHEGFVKVTAAIVADQLRIQVIDTGIGISSAFMPYLFEEFMQESTGLARTYEGNGLGLAIARRLVETLDGFIEVESEKGKGSAFTVWLPRRGPSSSKHA